MTFGKRSFINLKVYDHRGGRLVQWVSLGFESVWSLHVLYMLPRVHSFLPCSKDMPVRLIPESKLLLVMSV